MGTRAIHIPASRRIRLLCSGSTVSCFAIGNAPYLLIRTSIDYFDQVQWQAISLDTCRKRSLIHYISAFPILDRDIFTSKFHETYATLSPDDDFLWCATVNTVLAIGCRAGLDSVADQICGLFTNALSLFSKLAFTSSSLAKVQLLCLMVKYSDVIQVLSILTRPQHLFLSFTSAPHWGSTILAIAVKESQALGLHLQPRKSWGMTDDEIRQRSFLLWTLYLLDTRALISITS